MDRRVRPRSGRHRRGEGLVGQWRSTSRRSSSTTFPLDYIRIASGMGSASSRSVLVLPPIFEGRFAACSNWFPLSGFSPSHQAFLDQLTESIGITNTIEANMRTELCSNSPSRLPSSPDAIGRTAEDQPGEPAREVEVAGPAEPGGRAKEPGGGIRPAGTLEASRTASSSPRSTSPSSWRT